MTGSEVRQRLLDASLRGQVITPTLVEALPFDRSVVDATEATCCDQGTTCVKRHSL